MNNVSVNPELLSQYGKQIVGLATDYTTEINSVYKTIDELNNSWHGDAAQKFTAAVKNYEAELKSLGTKIQEMGNDLTDIANMYSSFNERIADAANNL